MSIRISLIFLGLLSMLIVSPAIAWSQEESCVSDKLPRLDLEVFRYAGDNAPHADASLMTFEDAVRSKLGQLATSLSQLGKDSNFLYLHKLSLYRKTSATGDWANYSFANVDRQFLYWKSNPTILAMLRGNVFVNDKNISIVTKIFVGDFANDIFVGDFANDTENVDLPAKYQADPANIESARETHSLMVLFLIVLDAMNRGCDKGVLMPLLGKLREQSLSIMREQGNSNPSCTQQTVADLNAALVNPASVCKFAEVKLNQLKGQ